MIDVLVQAIQCAEKEDQWQEAFDWILQERITEDKLEAIVESEQKG